ncbi:MAG: hypothetical protein M3R44_07480 [Candidatus Eremiobacteraeota bacterium]|nr:hypothetical protein [Candidatus Eremiobacteraeota bacterium]
MSALRQHVLDKYFGYRRLYVAHIERAAPQRGSLAVLSEIARLAFMIVGNALCALIFWVLTVSAAARAGGFGPWPVVFGICALLPTLFAVLSLTGLANAVRDRGRVVASTRSGCAEQDIVRAVGRFAEQHPEGTNVGTRSIARPSEKVARFRERPRGPGQ